MCHPGREGTADESYTRRLRQEGGRWWKRLLNVQYPYRWNLRRLNPGFVLDVGCGLGRHLGHVDGNGVGVDHNPTSVAECRARGFQAFTPEEFERSQWASAGTFDSVLLSHVAEHMRSDDVVALILKYAPYLKETSKLILITPQEKGFESDPTHVEFMDFAAVASIFRRAGFVPERSTSFPLPECPLGDCSRTMSLCPSVL